MEKNMKENMTKKTAFIRSLSGIPLPGQRIMRSVVAVWLCMVVYFLRGMHGEPFYSIIAALQCVQPYSSHTLSEGRERIIGTIIGAFWGSVILFAELLPSGSAFETLVLYYVLLGVFSGLVIYSTVLLHIERYALFSAVVFLGIAMYHLEDVNPYIHVLNRTLDTIIGVGVAILANSVHLPRVHDRSTLFVSGIDHVLFREDRQISSFTKVELNRFVNDGMRFSVSTRQTPATVREILSEVNLNLPIIAMDGAVLYDLRTMKYVRTIKMRPDLVTLLSDYLYSQGMPFFVNTEKDDLLVIYFKDYKDLVLEEIKDVHHSSADPERSDFALDKSSYVSMARLYHKKRSSPYRNYVRTNKPVIHDVIYLLVIDREEKIDRLHDQLMAQPWSCRIRTNFDTFDCEEGEKIMRIYPASATRSAMLKELQSRVGAPRTVTFGDRADDADVVISDIEHDQMVRELKKHYQPVSLRGWRNIIHL